MGTQHTGGQAVTDFARGNLRPRELRQEWAESSPGKRWTMNRSRFTEEQIIGILREREAGMATADVFRKHGISSATFYIWKAKYGGLEVSEAKRLKALEDQSPSSRGRWPRHPRQLDAEGRCIKRCMVRLGVARFFAVGSRCKMYPALASGVMTISTARLGYLLSGIDCPATNIPGGHKLQDDRPLWVPV